MCCGVSRRYSTKLLPVLAGHQNSVTSACSKAPLLRSRDPNMKLLPITAEVKKLDPVTLTKFRPLHQKLYIAKSEILARKAEAKTQANPAKI